MFSSFWTVEMQLIFIYWSNHLLKYLINSNNALEFSVWTITSSEKDSLISSLLILISLISFSNFTVLIRTFQTILTTVIQGTPSHSWLGRLASTHLAFKYVCYKFLVYTITSCPALQGVFIFSH